MQLKIKITDSHELAAFEKFKKIVADLNVDDDTIIRFLRAKDLDLEKAEEMLRNNVKWRIENNIDSYLHWKPSSPLFTMNYPVVCTGYDYEGSAVIYAPMGKWDTRAKLQMGLRADCEVFQYYMLEEIMYHIRNSNHSQMVFICDMEGYSYWELTHIESTQLLLTGFKLLEQRYPEILKTSIVINTSWIFTALFNFLKPAFTGKTMGKIQIYNSSAGHKVKKTLLDLMPEDVMPSCCKDIQLN